MPMNYTYTFTWFIVLVVFFRALPIGSSPPAQAHGRALRHPPHWGLPRRGATAPWRWPPRSWRIWRMLLGGTEKKVANFGSSWTSGGLLSSRVHVVSFWGRSHWDHSFYSMHLGLTRWCPKMPKLHAAERNNIYQKLELYEHPHCSGPSKTERSSLIWSKTTPVWFPVNQPSILFYNYSHSMSEWCCFRESYVDDMMKSLTLALTVLPPWRYVAMSFTWMEGSWKPLETLSPHPPTPRRLKIGGSLATAVQISCSVRAPCPLFVDPNDRNMFTQNPGLLVIPELGSLGVAWCRMLTYPMNPMFHGFFLRPIQMPFNKLFSIALVIPMGHVSAARNRGNRASPVKSTIVILIFYLNQGLERQVSRQTCSILSFSTHCYIMLYHVISCYI